MSKQDSSIVFIAKGFTKPSLAFKIELSACDRKENIEEKCLRIVFEAFRNVTCEATDLYQANAIYRNPETR